MWVYLQGALWAAILLLVAADPGGDGSGYCRKECQSQFKTGNEIAICEDGCMSYQDLRKNDKTNDGNVKEMCSNACKNRIADEIDVNICIVGCEMADKGKSAKNGGLHKILKLFRVVVFKLSNLPIKVDSYDGSFMTRVILRNFGHIQPKRVGNDNSGNVMIVPISDHSISPVKNDGFDAAIKQQPIHRTPWYSVRSFGFSTCASPMILAAFAFLTAFFVFFIVSGVNLVLRKMKKNKKMEISALDASHFYQTKPVLTPKDLKALQFSGKEYDV